MVLKREKLNFGAIFQLIHGNAVIVVSILESVHPLPGLPVSLQYEVIHITDISILFSCQLLFIYFDHSGLVMKEYFSLYSLLVMLLNLFSANIM